MLYFQISLLINEKDCKSFFSMLVELLALLFVILRDFNFSLESEGEPPLKLLLASLQC